MARKTKNPGNTRMQKNNCIPAAAREEKKNHKPESAGKTGKDTDKGVLMKKRRKKVSGYFY